MLRVLRACLISLTVGIVLLGSHTDAALGQDDRNDLQERTGQRAAVRSARGAAPHLAKPNRVVTVPKRIPSNGSHDVTAALSRFIESVPNNTIIRFAKHGRYRLDGTLEVRDRKGLWFYGRGSTVFARDRGDMFRRHLRFIGGGNLVIRNLTVKGANPNAGMADEAWDPNHEFQHGITLNGVQVALLDHVQVYDVYGDFVYVGPSNPSQGVFIPSRHVTITNSRFERNGRMGIAVDSAEDVLIEDNYMGDCRRSWVDVEPTAASWEVHRLTIRNNAVGPHRLNFFANAGQGDNIGDVVIANNHTKPGVTFGGINITRGDNPIGWGGYRGPYLIAGNVGPTRAGFLIRQATDVTIRGNSITPFPKRAVVILIDAHTIRVHDNDFTGESTALYQVNDPEPNLSYDYSESNNKR
jgi:Periplasmic copper-binding protein (NosD)